MLGNRMVVKGVEEEKMNRYIYRKATQAVNSVFYKKK